MTKLKNEESLIVCCSNGHHTVEPDFNETTRRYVCLVCASPVDAQVIIERKKRGMK